jgi:hypothetical protein
MNSIGIEDLVAKLNEIKQKGWVKEIKHGNHGAVGNTIEALLGVAENNLPKPDFGQWEIKAQRKKTTSLLSLFHRIPEPQGSQKIILNRYGWKHSSAGKKYEADEKRISLTLRNKYSVRGFCVEVDDKIRRVCVKFDRAHVSSKQKYANWLNEIRISPRLTGPQTEAYWDFSTIEDIAYKKLAHLVYSRADSKKVKGDEYFKYSEITIYTNPIQGAFIDSVRNGDVRIDFDLRSKHDHGPKFRIKHTLLNSLYRDKRII